MISEPSSKNKIIVLVVVIILLLIGGYMLFASKYLTRRLCSTEEGGSPCSVISTPRCTQEAKLCPDGSYVGRTGPQCEFTACPAPTSTDQTTLPQGYTMDSYRIEKVLETSCKENAQCETPMEYLVQSRCPFTSLCLENKCTVVCPDYVEAGWKTQVIQELGLSFKYPEKLTTQYISTVDWPPQVQVVDEKFTCTEAGNEIDRAGKTEKRTVDNRNYCVTRKTEGAAGSIYTQYAYAFAHGNSTVIFSFTLRSVQCGNYDEPKKTECEHEHESFDLDSVVDKMAQSIIFKAL